MFDKLYRLVCKHQSAVAFFTCSLSSIIPSLGIFIWRKTHENQKVTNHDRIESAPKLTTVNFRRRSSVTFAGCEFAWSWKSIIRFDSSCGYQSLVAFLSFLSVILSVVVNVDGLPALYSSGKSVPTAILRYIRLRNTYRLPACILLFHFTFGCEFIMVYNVLIL